MERYCTEYGVHTSTRLVEGDWPRCDECAGRLADDDPRMTRREMNT